MDLSRCTPGQYGIITTLDKPLMVSAGAGSGKTFTVTQRVVHALCDEQAANHIESLDEALIITFTKEAAKELRERIKNLLLKEGRGDLALDADNAWISTIHAMASQILKQNALVFGLDPAFELISDDLVKTYTDQAIEIVVEIVKETGTSHQKAYLASKALVETGDYGSSVQSDLEKLLGAVRSMPEGFASLVVPQAKHSPQEVLRVVVCAAEDLSAAMLTWGKQTKTIEKNIAALQDGIAAAYTYLEAHTALPSQADTWFDEAFDADLYLSVFAAFPATSPQFRREMQEGYDQVIAWREIFAKNYYEALLCCALPEINAIVDIAEVVDKVYQKLKGADRLDNTDLLVLLLRSFKEHPEIAQRYRDQFKLIMVDEFQDTDKLQVAVIDYLAQPGRTNITTVGDAQQSIYRFRGADVNVFFDYRDELATNPIAQFIELPDNFRSHADILAFVEAIFSQQEAFGKDFLALRAQGAVNQETDSYFEEHPRIEVAFVRANTKAQTAQENAHLIADHCAELVAGGNQAHDIAVLLGGMKHAHIYAQALRDKGLDVIISGGSVYKNFPEVHLVSDLLAFALNHDDDEALYRVLTSGVFDVSDDVLLYLTTRNNGQGIKRTSISKTFLSLRLLPGFIQEDREMASRAFSSETTLLDISVLSDADRQILRRASQVLYDFEQTVNQHEEMIVEAMRVVLYNSGYYARLAKQGAQGMAIAGNINKSLRLLAELQMAAPSLPALHEAYLSHLAFVKEKPGILQSTEMRCVRIMTTHSSKGLEFPHVIVADLGDGTKVKSGFVAENIGHHTYFTKFTKIPASPTVAQNISNYFQEYSFEQGLLDADPKQKLKDCSAVDMLAIIKAYNKKQILSEARRLLYVALTRASKSLFLICPGAKVSTSKKAEKAEESIAKGIYREVESALHLDPQGQVQMIPYGGSAPARVRVVIPQAKEHKSDAADVADQVQTQEEEQSRDFIVPRIQQHPLSTYYETRSVTRGEREGVYSYSSLDHEGYKADTKISLDQLDQTEILYEQSSYEFDEEEGYFEIGATEDDEFWDALADGELEDATNLGTAFHHLCEIAIAKVVSLPEGKCAIIRPDQSTQETQAKRFGLSSEQTKRLDRALDRWFSSDLIHSFESFGTPQAEVPFMVEINDLNTSKTIYLEGEIDGLACNDAHEAMFIDYKTGGFPDEEDDVLYDKHLQQAQCYACALMKNGYTKVHAYFVRVEQEDPHNPTQPQIVSYHFEQSDLPYIEQTIFAHAH